MALQDQERKQEVGVLALDQLLESELAEQDDRDVANAVMAALIPEVEDSDIEVEPDGGGTAGDGEDPG
jgi:hypothetical protein